MYYSDSELVSIGFKKIGRDVQISNKTSIYNPHLIEIGNNVRIDDFTILSPGKELIIGSHVHISCFCFLVGREVIELKDFSGISSRVHIFSSSDSYSGNYLTNPTIPEEFKKIISKPVILKEHCIVGTNSTILPGVTLGKGASVDAHSLVISDCKPFCRYGGVPAIYRKDRFKKLIELEAKFLQSKNLNSLN
jgi:galactoside O-acetyltransferase